MRAIRLMILGLPAAVAGCWFLSPTGLDGQVEAEIRASCHFAFTCCTAAERAAGFVAGGTFRDESTCVNEQLEGSNPANTTVARARAVLSAGKGTYNQGLADECLKDRLDALNSCDAAAVLAGPGASAKCADGAARGFVDGNVKSGDACTDSIECADSGVCDPSGNEDGTVTLEGKCRGASQKGGSCDGEGEFCAAGLFCRFDANTSEATCAELELLNDGADCSSDEQCSSGFCKSTEGQACVDSGAPCTDDSDCDTANFEICEFDFRAVCAKNDTKVEVCDGL